MHAAIPIYMPDSFIQDAALNTLSAFPPSTHPRVLDLSCGDGDIIAGLLRAGYQPEGTHFRKDDYIFHKRNDALDQVEVHDGVDLSVPLPFGDQSMDGVIATEVLEHLPNHSLVLSEISRILKPGGFFLFSTPNIHRLNSRLGFALHGIHELAGATIHGGQSSADLYSTHHNPVYFPVIHALLWQADLRIQQMAYTRANPSSWLALPLFYPLNALLVRLKSRRFRRLNDSWGLDLSRWMSQPLMLLNRHTLAVAKKENALRHDS